MAYRYRFNTVGRVVYVKSGRYASRSSAKSFVGREAKKGHYFAQPPYKHLKGIEFKFTPVKPYRLTLGLQYVWAHEYKSYTYTKFYKNEPTDKEVEEARKDAYEDIKSSTKFGKYDRSEWWFSDEFNLEITEVDEMGRDSIEHGSTSKPEKWSVGRDQLKTFAKRMISSGRWFKQATLEKWRGVLD